MSTVTTDAEFLARWRAGCREAGGALIDRYLPLLRRFFCNKVNNEVGDLVQQTLGASDCLDVERLMHAVEATGEAPAPDVPKSGAPQA